MKPEEKIRKGNMKDRNLKVGDLVQSEETYVKGEVQVLKFVRVDSDGSHWFEHVEGPLYYGRGPESGLVGFSGKPTLFPYAGTSLVECTDAVDNPSENFGDMVIPFLQTMFTIFLSYFATKGIGLDGSSQVLVWGLLMVIGLFTNNWHVIRKD